MDNKTYAEKLSKMIACETISVPDKIDIDKFHAFHEILAELFPNIHSKMEKIEFNGSLMFKIEGESHDRPLMLMSHMDVVEATGKWQHEPFSGYIDEKRVWGRGTLDTKGSLFAIMQSIEELLEEGYSPKQDLYLVSSCTEEVGGEGGIAIAKHLKEKGVKIGLLIDEGGAIMDEPIKGAKARFAMVGVIEKGGADINIIARSNGGHSSAPPKNSPIARLSKFVNELEEKDPFKVKISKEVRAMLSVLAPHMSGIQGWALKNLWLTAPLLKKLLPRISDAAGAMLKTTVAFTMQSGSMGANVLPERASLTINMRFIPHQNRDESIEIIKKIADKHKLEVEVLSSRASTEPTNIDGFGYQYVKRIIESVFPKVYTAPYVMVGGTDSRFYIDITTDVIRFAPIFMDSQQFASVHGTDENIYTDCLKDAVEFYRQIALNYK